MLENSSMNLNNTDNSSNEEWIAPDILIKCSESQGVGIYLVILFAIALIINSELIWILLKHKKELLESNSVNIMILILTILSQIGTIFELPLVFVTAFKCYFIFPKYVCAIEAFIMYFVACTSIYILGFISCTRYRAINEPLKVRKNWKVEVLIASVVSIVMGLFWSVAPLFGWSEYSLEGAMISCSVEWNKKTASVMSYNITIAIFVFLVPMLVFIITNIQTFCIMRSSREKFAYLNTYREAREKIKLESLIAMRAALIILSFIISWCPYACVCLYRAFLDQGEVSPLLATIPALFAKASLAWPALFTLIGNKEIRNKICGYEEFMREKNRRSIAIKQ